MPLEIIVIIVVNKELHKYKDEKEIKFIKDREQSFITYDEGFLICYFKNIIYVINVNNFSIEKNIKDLLEMKIIVVI